MILSPSDPSTLMGKAFGETIRPFRGLGTPDRPASVAEVASLRILIEESAAIGVAAFDAIMRFDLNWRSSVFRGEIEHDEAIERLILDNIRSWVENADSFASVVETLRAHGNDFPAVAPVRERLVEARGMLTPDDGFFEGETLDELAARALAEDEKGLTVEFGSMSAIQDKHPCSPR